MHCIMHIIIIVDTVCLNGPRKKEKKKYDERKDTGISIQILSFAYLHHLPEQENNVLLQMVTNKVHLLGIFFFITIEYIFHLYYYYYYHSIHGLCILHMVMLARAFSIHAWSFSYSVVHRITRAERMGECALAPKIATRCTRALQHIYY